MVIVSWILKKYLYVKKAACCINDLNRPKVFKKTLKTDDFFRLSLFRRYLLDIFIFYSSCSVLGVRRRRVSIKFFS
jgi:hypothetical protein